MGWNHQVVIHWFAKSFRQDPKYNMSSSSGVLNKSFVLFDFYPDPWGNDPIWRAYFSNGLVERPMKSRFSLVGFNVSTVFNCSLAKVANTIPCFQSSFSSCCGVPAVDKQSPRYVQTYVSYVALNHIDTFIYTIRNMHYSPSSTSYQLQFTSLQHTHNQHNTLETKDLSCMCWAQEVPELEIWLLWLVPGTSRSILLQFCKGSKQSVFIYIYIFCLKRLIFTMTSS